MATVLIVDDSAVDREFVRHILSEDGQLNLKFAEDGTHALAVLDEQPVELVVTDLQMPDMDGLELVTNVRVHHCDVPVVLITAHGSEQLAIEALERGAASYVPKTQLKERLRQTVHDLLAQVTADRTYERLLRCFESTEFQLSLTNNADLIDPLVDLIQQTVGGMALCDTTGQYRVGVAVKEALLNALYRGNLEVSYQQMQDAREQLLAGRGPHLIDERRNLPPYCDRKIHVLVTVNQNEARFVIRDEGPGFDVGRFLETNAAPQLESASGRGLTLMRSLMDEVSFNATGNEVCLVKRREHP